MKKKKKRCIFKPEIIKQDKKRNVISAGIGSGLQFHRGIYEKTMNHEVVKMGEIMKKKILVIL